MQGAWVGSLAWEDSTCCRTAEPMRHDYWACALESASLHYWAWAPQSLSPATGEATAMRSPPQLESRPCSLQLKKACVQQRWPSAVINEINNFFKKDDGNCLSVVDILNTMVFNGGWYPHLFPQGHLTTSGDSFGCYNWSRGGHWYLESSVWRISLIVLFLMTTLELCCLQWPQ